jgi:glyoxylase-like metal-dependent hydrolase (beta-lactamase superfamily II)
MDHKRTSLDRRQLLIGSSTLAFGAAQFVTSAAFASASLLHTRPAAFYRFQLGAFEATIISDGPLNFPTKIFRGVPEADIQEMLVADFLPADTVRMEQNILVINTGAKLIMIDTGILSMKPATSTAGRILTSLAEAGIEPASIDAIVLSHPHIDHAGGIMMPDGKTRLFPNAQIYTTDADFKFWTNEKLLGTPAQASARTAIKNLLPNKDRLVMYTDGQEIFPGIHAMSTPGHTVGHSSFMIQSNGQSLLYTGDVVLHEIMMENPRVAVSFDTDSDQGVRTRMRVLDMLAHDNVQALIFHMAWPGVGHVVKGGSGYRFVPTPVIPVL